MLWVVALKVHPLGQSATNVHAKPLNTCIWSNSIGEGRDRENGRLQNCTGQGGARATPPVSLGAEHYSCARARGAKHAVRAGARTGRIPTGWYTSYSSPLVGVIGEPKSLSDPPAEVSSWPLCDEHSFSVSPGEKRANPLRIRLPGVDAVVDMPYGNPLFTLHNDPLTGGAAALLREKERGTQGNQRYARHIHTSGLQRRSCNISRISRRGQKEQQGFTLKLQRNGCSPAWKRLDASVCSASM